MGPIFFNIYINDPLSQFVNTSVCNFADDNTPGFCDIDLASILANLENDVLSARYQTFSMSNVPLTCFSNQSGV